MTDERDCPMCRDYLALGERCVHESDATRAEREAVEAAAMVPPLRELVAELKAERDALRARVAELEEWSADTHLKRELEAACEHAEAMEAERDAAPATLERVREALGHSGDGPAIDTLARVEAALAPG